MEASRPPTIPPANPPSVEIAYKRKCIALKRRLAEIETENELMRTQHTRSHQFIQKMRLETCMLLERLNKITSMSEEAKTGTINPDLRARAAALMTVSGLPFGAGAVMGTLEDDTEGSSDEQPRTPEERPLRVKRSRKSAVPGIDGADEDLPAGPDGHHNEHVDPAGLPHHLPAPTQESLTHSFRVQTGSGSADQTPAAPEAGPEAGAMSMDTDKGEVKEEAKEQL
ncbi:uncharacterized protein N7511_007595 [Penicillium nucicola]|uniref:uncharacterized protein n=1 Tax=Penicillium nucicola TaxID=1850975 RepID=UPI0025455096|nr:uncharacterized protein N7511_007595 [Penicillium nucicola]KAJ5753442.1 hypothetical protein N7511_007595 [Penicillium nucicola]